MASIYRRLSSNNYSTFTTVGGATAANQLIEINLLTNIDAELVGANVTLLSIDSHVDGVETILTSIDGKLTSPLSVTGPLTDVQLRASPVPVSASIPGVATSANQTNASQKTQIVDGSGNVISSTSNALDVNIASAGTLPISGSVSVSNFPATQAVSAVSLPLPTGASTAALQTTGNSSLASIDSKLTSPLSVTGPLTDVQLRASAVPVSLTSVTGTDGAAEPTNALAVGGVTAGGIFKTFETNASGHLNISDGGGSITVDVATLPLPTGLQPSFSEFTISATGSNNYDNNISGYATLIVTVTGTWTGTLEWYGSVDGTTYVNLAAMNVLDFSGESQLFVTTNSTSRLDVSGFKFFRVKAIAVTGTATVIIGASNAQSIISQIQSSIFVANTSLPVTPSSSTGLAPATAAVTNVSSTVVASNANRKGLIIVNTTLTPVFLSFGAPAVANSGIMLVKGGTFVMDSFTFTTQNVRAIVASGTTTLSIQEME